MATRYKNETTGEWYTEGRSMTRLVDNILWSGTPTTEQLTEWGFSEYVAPTIEATPYTPTYEELVVQKIRAKYSMDDELAILRQRDTKAEEFAEYNAFCEQCKAEAKAETTTEEEES